MKVNLNDSVRFKLTPAGRVQMEAAWFPFAQTLRKPLAEIMPKPDADGVYTMQLWQVMRDLGPVQQLGNDASLVSMSFELLDVPPSEKASPFTVDAALQMASLREIAGHAERVCDLVFKGQGTRSDRRGYWVLLREAVGVLNAALLGYKTVHGAP